MKAAVDRIEGPVAVLIACEGEPARISVPVSLLPPGTREGDVVTLTLERDEAATKAAKETVSGLIEKLKKR
nr:DUF3006 domain-containing protein [uncultured Methanoregula sp.]